jgi:hypothetical protein
MRGEGDAGVARRRRVVKRGPFSRVVEPPGGAAALRRSDGVSAADPAVSDDAVVVRPSRRAGNHASSGNSAAVLLARFTREELTQRKAWIRKHVVCRRGTSRLVVCSHKTGAVVSYVPIRADAAADDISEAAELLVESVAARLASMTLPASVRMDRDDALDSDDDATVDDAKRLLGDVVQLYRPLGSYTR